MKTLRRIQRDSYLLSRTAGDLAAAQRGTLVRRVIRRRIRRSIFRSLR